METSTTAAVFWLQQTTSVVAKRLVKKVRSRTEERSRAGLGGGVDYRYGFASTMLF